MNLEEIKQVSDTPKKKSLRSVWIILIILVLGVGTYAATKSSLFSVKEVEVVGSGVKVSLEEEIGRAHV